ncbi:hypothetical protein UPYG_G00326540 [Umbra pygmaea]|uniref:Uncharacterized protein n=1 Tax=Umbra pygmaea TaxID=75934 RepID=A0ABD0W242_UMBPY
MVAVMRITRDICRLFGIGSEAPTVQPQQDMGCVAETPDTMDDVTLSQEPDITGEEDLCEEEKARRRAERRRAKRKRQRERKKLEQVKMPEGTKQDNDEYCFGSEAEEDDSGSEVEEEKREEEEKKEYKAVISDSKDLHNTSPSGAKGPENVTAQCPEEEPEWDVSSAFFANAASHIKPKGWTKLGCRGKENKENEARTKDVNGTDTVTRRSASLTEKGIQFVQEGQYSQAVSMFTEAIRCDPNDYRFFGNRSYCYGCLDQYPQALADAEMSIQLAPTWAKGHFRKGSALMGMKRYSEAEKAMEQVLKFDKDCEEAVNDLFNCKVLQLMELGFDEIHSVSLLERFTTVQAVLASSEALRAVSQNSSLTLPGWVDICQLFTQSPCASLWVGNVCPELTEKHLWDLFKTYGDIDSIRVLHERTCAFVNFKSINMAAEAMEKLNGYNIENNRLVIRYPDRRTQKILPVPLKNSTPASLQTASATGSFSSPRRRGPVNGNECYFWRTTGCHFGEKCRYKHIPEQKGQDRKPWQP